MWSQVRAAVCGWCPVLFSCWSAGAMLVLRPWTASAGGALGFSTTSNMLRCLAWAITPGPGHVFGAYRAAFTGNRLHSVQALQHYLCLHDNIVRLVCRQ